MNRFELGRQPELTAGTGSFAAFLDLVDSGRYKRIALFTGSESFKSSRFWDALVETFDRSVDAQYFTIVGEPSPEFIDTSAAGLRSVPPDLVAAIGGGSVIDAAKAVAAVATVEESVERYLEGVGDLDAPATSLQVAAIPTTAGTGSEATKNAVISRIGPGGFKKSLRHESYVPKMAYLDPQLTATCPPDVTAASGLDALTQLLEAYISSKANPYTDLVARDGLRRLGRSLERAVHDGSDLDARSDMALAAYYSGVALMNAGLGIVHGLASPVGALREAPHGVVCGTLVATSTALIVEKLKHEPGAAAGVALCKLADCGVLLTGTDAGTPDTNRVRLVECLFRWVEEFRLPNLGTFGITESDVPGLAASAGLKNTPVHLDTAEIEALLRSRL